VPALNLAVRSALGEFAATDFPAGFATTTGAIRPFDERAVLRHLSAAARPISTGSGGVIELYQDAERFWLIDERWGLAEINLLRGSWQSWVLTQTWVDPVRLVENAVVWPLAQLLRGKGLSLIPAVGLSVMGRGILVISPFGVHRELRAAVVAGARVVGQQWTALREEDGRVSMLRMPGRVETQMPPRLRNAEAATRGARDRAADQRSLHGGGRASEKIREPHRPRSDIGIDVDIEVDGGIRADTDRAPLRAMMTSQWTDVCADAPRSAQHHAFVDAVVVVDRGRRPAPLLRSIARRDATALLKQTWPILELHPHRRTGAMAARLAQHTRTFEIQLSRDPNDFSQMLHRIAGYITPPRLATHASAGQPRVELTLPRQQSARRIPA
jgi:hypothetical protein